jgi:adenine-specific DNA-methyltransferase
VDARVELEPRTASIGDVFASFPAWWARCAADAQLSREWQDWRRALPPPPLPLGETPSRVLVDRDAFALGEAYLETLDAQTRLREGRHYTPAALSDSLWREIQSVGNRDGLVLDPACGTGALLLPALRAFVKAARDAGSALADLPRKFAGTDVDEVAVWLGNALLGAEMLPLWAELHEDERQRLPQLLRTGDGLAEPAQRPETIVLNPPYGRIRLDPSARKRWHASLYGHANRYGLFLHAAVEHVADGGLVGAVIPTSFLGGAYYQRLRAFLATRAPLTRLVFVDERAGVFVGGVLQETCLAVFQKGSRRRRVACAQIAVNGRAEVKKLAVATIRRESDSPWMLPRRPSDAPMIKKAASLSARLGDYGWCVATGPLVWNRHKEQIFDSPARRRLPIVWAADLNGGTVLPDESRAHRRWIALRERDRFMVLREPAILVQRTTAPEQTRRLIVALLDARALKEWGGEVVVENHVNVLRSGQSESPIAAELLRRLLGTPTIDRLYRCLTGSEAVSAYELEALPLPSPEFLRSLASVPDEVLVEAIARHYGDDAA